MRIISFGVWMLIFPWLASTTLSAGELTLSAPPAIDNITHSSARVCWATSGSVPASKQLAFDTTANFTTTQSLAFKTVGLSSASFPTMCMALSGLTAGTSYTVCPSIADGNGNSTNCAGNSNSRAVFTTLALPSTHPALPVAPSTFDTSYPTIDVMLTVASDCSNLQSTLAAAYGAGNMGKTVKVIYPSFQDQTSTNCNRPLNLAAFTKSGAGTVVITSSDEASGPGPGVRTSTSNKNQSWMLCTAANIAALTPTSSTRLVDLYLEPCDSTASVGQGDPQITSYLARFDSGVNNLVFDRVNFDGRGYPFRVQTAAYGYGNNVAFVDSYFNHIEIWQPWVDTTSISIGGNSIVSGLPFLMGHGDTTSTVGTFTVTQASGTGNAYLSVRAAGAVEYRYSDGSASCSSPCTAVLDPALSLPTDARPITWNGSSRLISYASGTFSPQTSWSRTHLPDLLNGSGSVQANEWDATGITSDSCAGSSPTAKRWVIRNTFLGVTGFGVFAQGGCAGGGPGFVVDTSDWTIDNNTIQSNDSCLVAFATVSASSSPFLCSRRHHVELKNGYRFSITNNQVSNGFIAVAGNGGYAIDLKQDYIGNVSAVSDIYIAHNTFTDEPACFYLAGDTNNTARVNYTKLISRVLIEQNICQANAFTRSQFDVGTGQDTMTNGGLSLWIEEETEDVVLRHNTFYQPRGSVASAVLLSDRWSEGLSLLNNIFFVNSPLPAYRGIQAAFTNDPGWTMGSTPAFNTASGADGTAALNNVTLPGSSPDVRRNLFIAACLNPSTCNDSTPAGSLVGDLSSQYPPSSFWIASGTFGARQDAVGWINRASFPSGLYLASSSPYHNAGTDGLDIGVTTGISGPTQGTPTITITSPTSGSSYSTSSSTINLSGTASDSGGITQVTWVTDHGTSGVATGTSTWSVSGIALQAGSNNITVTAHDSAGNQASATLTVTLSTANSPLVAITSPTSSPSFSTSSTSINVGGTASDSLTITQVTWTSDHGGSGTATGTNAWSANGIALQSGSNVITITARDSAGNQASKTLTVTVGAPDSTPPTIAITSPTSAPTFTTSNGTINLSGTASDNVGVAQVTWVTSRGASGTATGTTSWTISGVVLPTGSTGVTVTAHDAAGNVTSAILNVTYTAPDSTPPAISITSPTSAGTYTASSGSIILGGTASDNVGVTQVTWVTDRGGSGTAAGTTSWLINGVQVASGTTHVTVTASDAAGNIASSVLTISYTPPDTTPPAINITSPTSGATYSTSSTSINLSGTASDNVGVTQVTWVTSRGASGVASGTANWTITGLGLPSGTTQVTVTAGDAAGNAATAVLTVTSTAADTVPPTVSITSPAPAYSTSSTAVALAGTASDNVGVTQVTWVTDRGASGSAAGTTSWTIGSVPLQSGQNTITVTARDAAGNQATAAVVVTSATGSTTITITSPTADATFHSSQSTINLAGTASGNTAQVSWVSDQGGQGQAAGTANWNVSGIALKKGTNRITVTASDAGGNPSSAQITIQVSNPSIVNSPLPPGKAGKLYSHQLSVVDGIPPFSWSAGSLPNGLVLTAAGTISGTPVTTGAFTLDVAVRDSVDAAANASVNLEVDDWVALVSSASLVPGPVAPESMVTAFGWQLAAAAQTASTSSLPTKIGDSSVTVRDVNGVERPAALYYVSPSQINFTIPADTAVGPATAAVYSGNQVLATGSLQVLTMAPALFFLNQDELAAAGLVRVTGDTFDYETTSQFDTTTNQFVAVPIDLGADTDQVYLTLYGTGFRFRSSLDSAHVYIGDVLVPVSYAGPSGTFDGVDIVNMLLPQELRGKGTADVSLTVNGATANVVRVVIK